LIFAIAEAPKRGLTVTIAVAERKRSKLAKAFSTALFQISHPHFSNPESCRESFFVFFRAQAEANHEFIVRDLAAPTRRVSEAGLAHASGWCCRIAHGLFEGREVRKLPICERCLVSVSSQSSNGWNYSWFSSPISSRNQARAYAHI
jgi:hypothetical protein